MAIKFNTEYNKLSDGFIPFDKITAYQSKIDAAFEMIKNSSGMGSDCLGWVNLPIKYETDECAKKEYQLIKSTADDIITRCDILIVIGIGGSYLGAKAAIDFVKSPRYNNLKKNTPDIYFTGNDLNTSALAELLEICKGKDVCVNVISKSGKTTEPAIAFRVFRELLEEKYGEKGAKKRIFVTTDKEKGALRTLANEKGYTTFSVPDDIGGRYSVLSAVGLLPIAVAGIDIDAMMRGAVAARDQLYEGSKNIEYNDCMKYAAMRSYLYNKGKKATEIMVNYDNALVMLSEWWKQLFGESEGKDSKGLFPASVTFTTDLHSLGQFIQQGKRNIFETVINIKESARTKTIPLDDADLDELNYIAKQNLTLHEINATALKATVIAHVDGGVPNIVLDIDRRDAENFGYFVYFFELACAVSGYMLEVNPFDQPGVEGYKDNMFALLGKEGKNTTGKSFDTIREEIKKLL